MAKKINQSDQKSTKKPSRVVSVLALVFALCLPYILVTTFSGHDKTAYEYSPVSLPKLKRQVMHREKPAAKDNSWQIIDTQPGDTLSAVFSRLGLSAKNLHEVVKDNPHGKILTNIKPQQQLQFLIKDRILERLILPFTSSQYLVIYKDGDRYLTKIESRKMNSHNHYITATVQGSLFGTAKKQNIPYKLMHQMTDIFNWEIDFARDVRAGDRFTMIYKAYYIEDKLVGTGDIVAVSYTSRDKTFQAVKHTNAAGESDYYTPTGTSLKKAFSRYPLKFSHISSTFSLSRFHPVLHYNRPHKGVDLAARIGTPIMATGNGVIEFIGRHSGYGNMVKIKHDSQFSSVYGHMLKFQKGLSKGSKVKRGQVIGFVGQSGLATGPHCHYEFHIKNNPKNPATVALPRANPIPSRELAAFRAHSGTVLAHLKLFEDANIASTARKQEDVG